MRRLEYFMSGIVLATDAATLTLPPGSVAYVGDWSARDIGATPEFELEIWSDSTVAITNAVLYGGRLHPWVIADITVTSVTNATNTLNKVAHGLNTGDGPLYFTSTLTYPAGLATGVRYWAIKTGNDTFKLADSLEHAFAGTEVDFTTNGTGVLKILDSEVAGDLTQRVAWTSHDGFLGLLGDGDIAVDADLAYSKRIAHSPRVFAYALVATLDTDTVWASIYPIQDR